MKKVISFSLWGDIPRYTIGAVKNAELALLFYPDFECWFYIHKDSVPVYIVQKLQTLKNTKIIFKEGDLKIFKPMTWRFEAIDEPDVEINMSRDTDTRILLREKLAVDEWIKSGKIFHIMRDHPHHMNKETPIMGGMFGTRKIKDISSWLNLIQSKELNDKGRQFYNKDQDFLNKYIYPIIKNDCLIHSSFGKLLNERQEDVKTFPIKYCDKFLFVGGYVYEDETVSKEHSNILQKCLLIK
jgi:hypothetical protein